MQTQRRRDTKVELQVRRRLHAAGLRYRVDFRPEASLRCRGDIVFTRPRVVVFIDGCFWHGCPVHATQPKNNVEWWRKKLDANMDRDRRNSAALESLGWGVLRFWEHESPVGISQTIWLAVRTE
ncbi:very short patch repair endonuclease [Williamsia muralis]|uniref:Very short patch repair endonuclease n=1 Tax=Williamsia marianensis TaxID=85044 RepID=A0A2G3PRH5_WILMA|nr:very short patch repair endonuclease [Williamsia marianensis]PHV68458.1 very short patch repair endonuclease [Williamsia marianensis]